MPRLLRRVQAVGARKVLGQDKNKGAVEHLITSSFGRESVRPRVILMRLARYLPKIKPMKELNDKELNDYEVITDECEHEGKEWCASCGVMVTEKECVNRTEENTR